ncbi:N-acetylneuraminate synthase [Paraliobacillus salinarum]|uniref:N-acetylneuraminate synthase n=1 Tax=Paraliobacillus salinarum TaxID=1158996 RepID=UPI0015F4DF8A|nr:N-acetylneuraminate synthase [Paraliobacillus salinarum]
MSNVIIIAEAGVNHNGSVDIAKQLIEEAAKAGADYVKFQTFKAEKLVAKHAPKANYQNLTTDNRESQYEMIKKLELDLEMHHELIRYSKKRGIEFLSTAFDIESAELLNDLGIDFFKVPSGEITNLPFLENVGSFGKDVILSTGMSSLGEIESAVNVLYDAGAPEIIVLHCNTEYPTPIEDVNLLAMNTIKNAFNVDIGYSDHTNGIEIPIAAVALGAKVIEKHFTLDRNMEGPDHRASLEPHELAQLVKSIRNIELALGDGIKKPSKSEFKNKSIARKSIVAETDIAEGEIFSSENLAIKRPGNGLSPMMWYEIIGKKASRDFKKDELINL